MPSIFTVWLLGGAPENFDFAAFSFHVPTKGSADCASSVLAIVTATPTKRTTDSFHSRVCIACSIELVGKRGGVLSRAEPCSWVLHPASTGMDIRSTPNYHRPPKPRRTLICDTRPQENAFGK